MKPIRGLLTDVNPIDVPDGKYIGAKNIVIDKKGAISNERGFDILLANLFTDTNRKIGIIESADGIAIVFRYDTVTLKSDRKSVV